MTKQEIIAKLKKDHPEITLGSDEQGYEVLETKEYNAMIESWADDLYNREVKEQELLQSQQALFNRLGITAEEAKLLLA